jgi:DNA polymerase type B, organellar and viral
MSLRILKPSKTFTVPTRAVFLDVEPLVKVPRQGSARREHVFGLGTAKCCFLSSGRKVDEEKILFDRPQKFWDWLDTVRSRKSCTWVFAHNIGYDLTLLEFWDQLMRSTDEVVGFVVEDPPTIITIRRKKCLIKFVDVLNYWRLPVCDLARLNRQPLQSVGVLAVGDTPTYENCESSVEVIERCVLALVSLLSATSLCSFRPTASAISWDAWSKSFMTCRMVFGEPPKARTLARESYFGGRAQVFRLGKVTEPVSVADVQSLYPAVMKADLYPRQFVNYTEELTLGDLADSLVDFDACARVTLRDGHQPYPTRTEVGNVYSRNRGEYCLAGNELRSALAAGMVIGVYAAGFYARGDLFSRFVDHFYEEKVTAREAGDLPREMLAKLVLNSLYGKFAQRGRKWVKREDLWSPGPYQYWWHHSDEAIQAIRCRSVALRVESQTPGPDPVQTLPAVSACITANARTVLERLFNIADYANVYYTDTDSLHVNGDGLLALERSGEVEPGALGKLRIIARGTSAYYWGHQHYRVGDRYVCSQIKPDAVEIADGLYLQEARAGLQMTLEKGLLDRVEVSGRVIDLKGGRCHES